MRLTPEELDAWVAWPRRMVVRIDATGVGATLVELVVDPLKELDARVVPTTFTAGERITRHANGDVSVGKPFLISHMQGLVESGRVRFAKDSSEITALGDELKVYEIRPKEDTGALQLGAFGSAHDDLASALALAVMQRVHLEPARVIQVWPERLSLDEMIKEAQGPMTRSMERLLKEHPEWRM